MFSRVFYAVLCWFAKGLMVNPKDKPIPGPSRSKVPPD